MRTTFARIATAVLLTVCIGAGGYVVTMKVAEHQEQQYLEGRESQVAAAAAAIDLVDVQALKGRPSDEDTAAFKRVRAQMQRVKRTDGSIRFIYLMAPVDGKMVFLADAEPATSDDYSPPGEVYEEAMLMDFLTFNGLLVPEPDAVGPVRDRWGNWISASAYILDERGQPIALLGTDVAVGTALASVNQIRYIGLAFNFAACLLLALLLTQWILWQRGRERRREIHRHMDESIMKINKELIEADRVKSEFIESAAHELRGPVTALDTAISVLESQMETRALEEDRALLRVAKAGSDRLVDLVANLLDLTRMQVGGFEINREDVDIGELVRDTALMFSVMAREKGIDIEVEVSGENLLADADPEVLRRLLENLISNAIKYTEKGCVNVQACAGPESIRFTVTDTGRGIPEEYQAEVFKKFSRLHRSTDVQERGAGLGLAISRGLVEAHHGRIWLESIEGGGSSFHFEIPRA